MSATIGRYEIIEELGTGGMATVYRARDPRFGREVALKVMSADFAHNPTFAQRFEREARTIATLEHPAITPVHDFGEHEGQPFLVMRYMSGGSLANRIRRGPLSLEESAHVLDRIADALDWAHDKGIIHRDIKPANILFDQHDRPCLADFGIVKLTESTAHLTGSGIVGTPSYMAPEMMEEGGLTHLVDVYALGVTLYEMLAGQRPYKSDTPMGIIMAHIGKPIPDIRQARPDLPATIQAVIERGMAKDPVDRFQTAGALAAAFHEALRYSVQPAEQVIDRPDLLPITPEPATFPTEPDAPTVDIVEDTSPSPPAHYPEPTRIPIPPLPDTPLPESAKQIGVGTGVRAIPWAWIGGIGAVIVVGIIGLLVLLNGAASPKPEPTQTVGAQSLAPTSAPEATSIPLGYPGNPVTNNDQWTPVIDEFNGVQMALVPVGCFMMGSEDYDDEQPIHKVCFDEPFWIDIYEVTNEAFGSVGCESYSSDPDQPRICVNWTDSLAHCESRGARLPTEAEWEYAARGPDGLVYPWGNTFDGNLVNFCDENCTDDWADKNVDDGYQNTAPVGSYPGGVSWVGAYDLSGNVWERVNSLYMDYPYDPDDGREADSNSDSSNARVLRGGSWLVNSVLVCAASQSGDDPFGVGVYNDVGFRCALSY